LNNDSSLDNEKGQQQEIPLEPCCGQQPVVKVWPRNRLALVTCQNTLCPNHYGVLADLDDIEGKWNKVRNGAASV